MEEVTCLGSSDQRILENDAFLNRLGFPDPGYLGDDEGFARPSRASRRA